MPDRTFVVEANACHHFHFVHIPVELTHVVTRDFRDGVGANWVKLSSFVYFRFNLPIHLGGRGMENDWPLLLFQAFHSLTNICYSFDVDFKRVCWHLERMGNLRLSCKVVNEI